MSADAGAIVELSGDECLGLLRSQGVGRFAVAIPDSSPLVVPVNFVLDGDVVVFRSAPGTKLTALAGIPVSFEVDHIDRAEHTGWSVLVRGTAYEATRRETEHLDLPTWAPGEKRHWVRIVPDSVTGRRITGPGATS